MNKHYSYGISNQDNILIVELNLQKYKVQHYNTHIRLFSKYDIENTQVMLIIHVWYAQPMCQLPHKSHMANSIIFKF